MELADVVPTGYGQLLDHFRAVLVSKLVWRSSRMSHGKNIGLYYSNRSFQDDQYSIRPLIEASKAHLWLYYSSAMETILSTYPKTLMV
ncbi:Transcriptional regulator ADR1 [Fusarium oxysporum f. sp. albedinis]|nr:Transcriptional regulator ADR1 [Fusarium oxysporum f. sp. albedinis]